MGSLPPFFCSILRNCFAIAAMLLGLSLPPVKFPLELMQSYPLSYQYNTFGPGLYEVSVTCRAPATLFFPCIPVVYTRRAGGFRPPSAGHPDPFRRAEIHRGAGRDRRGK